MAEIFLSNLEKALNSLQTALEQEKNEFLRDSVIQRFEYSYELNWKTLKKYLKEFYGVDEGNVKELYRIAAKHSLIDNLDNWFRYHQARNITSHSYNEDNAEEVYGIAPDFLQDARNLFIKIQDGIAS